MAGLRLLSLRVRIGALAAVSAAVVSAAALPSPAWAAPVLEAQWNFEEPAGSTVAHDSSGNGHDATVDSRYRNVAFGGYDSSLQSHYVHMDMGLLRAPSTPDLVPGTRDITLQIQVRTSDPTGFANFFQKGTYARKGGFWKIEMSRGHARCRFTGDLATAGFEAGPPINDGRWHTITCTKTSATISLYIDGVFIKKRNVAVGAITNNDDIAIGGKFLKAGAPVDSEDMLHGDLNYAKYSLG